MPATRPPTFDVQLDGRRRFRASADVPLLQSAAQAGLELKSSCRNGTCRACMRRLRSGHVAYRIDWPGLLAEEKAEGWVLPCVAYPQSDLVFDEGKDVQ